MTTVDVKSLMKRIEELEAENLALKRSGNADLSDLERALAAREIRYQALFDSIDEGFCIIEFFDGPHGQLSDYIHIEANPAYARHTGIANVVGQRVRQVVPDEADGWVELYRNVLITGQPIRFERELVATGRYLELAAFRIEPQSEKQVAVLFQDVTARKRAEDDLQKLNETLETRVSDALAERDAIEDVLRQSQKMEAVGQLTGGIAHDFNNMLAIIIGSLRLAERKLAKRDYNIEEYLSGAMQGADRAATLVSRLLAFSRQQPLSPKTTDSNKLVADIEMVLRRTIPESIVIEIVRAGGLWSIYADPHGLESAIVNLAVNARDAMPDGGKLTIETANAYLDDQYAGSHVDVTSGQYVLIALTDNGTGMSRDVVSRAFEPFFTTKAVGAGTGLGLSQVYGFVKQSGGHVKIYSEEGVGTTVKIYIPRSHVVSEATATSQTAQIPRDHQSERGEPVLVVEDDDDVRRLTVEILTELGYAVHSARDGAQGLAIIDKHPELVLLMTDVVMPGMNGRVLAKQAVTKLPHLKVLFTTGYTRNAIVHNGLLDQGVELIVKPFTFEALAAKVASIVGRKI